MKLLIFHIGKDRYGLRLHAIVRVLPLLELKHLPLAPDYVAGLMNFHGASVPVIDLCLLGGMASGEQHVDSRIIVIDYIAPDGTRHLLGLLAEHVLGIRTVLADQLAESGVEAAPFLGQVAGDDQGILQIVEPDQLLSAAVRAMLFQPVQA